MGHSGNTGVLPAKDRMDVLTSCTGDPSGLNSDGKKANSLIGSSHHQGGQISPFSQGVESQQILLGMEKQLLL